DRQQDDVKRIRYGMHWKSAVVQAIIPGWGNTGGELGQIVAFSILAVTVGVALGRPQIGSRRFGHGEAALIGAVLAVATGSVSLHQVAHAAQILAFPAVTIVSLMTITVIAEQTGLLRLMADRLARRAGGDANRLFRNLFILGALTGTFFTNDA